MAVKIKNTNKLKKIVESVAIDNALLEVAEIVKVELKENIAHDYLDKYTPKYYERTDKLEQVTDISKLYSSPNMRKIDIGFLEENDYEYHSGFTGQYAWSNMTKGFHGSDSPNVPYTLTSDMITEPSPMDTTRDWVHENANQLLKKSLKKQGYNIK